MLLARRRARRYPVTCYEARACHRERESLSTSLSCLYRRVNNFSRANDTLAEGRLPACAASRRGMKRENEKTTNSCATSENQRHDGRRRVLAFGHAVSCNIICCFYFGLLYDAGAWPAMACQSSVSYMCWHDKAATIVARVRGAGAV